MKRVQFTIPKPGAFAPLTADTLISLTQSGLAGGQFPGRFSVQAVQSTQRVDAQKAELERELAKALGSLELDVDVAATHVTPHGPVRELTHFSPAPGQVVPTTPVPDVNVRPSAPIPAPVSASMPAHVGAPYPAPAAAAPSPYPAPVPAQAAQMPKETPLGLKPMHPADLAEHESFARQANLVGAIFRSDLNELLALLRAGVSPNQTDDARTYPALHFAVHRDMYYFVEALLDAGADPNAVGHDLQTPMHCAQSLAVGVLLHRRGARLSARNSLGQEPIHTLADRGCTLLVDYCVSHGVSINIRDEKGKSALHWAAWGGQVQTLEWLVRNGCDMWVRDDEQAYPLHWATIRGHFEVVRTIKRLLGHEKFYKQLMTPMSENRTVEHLLDYHLNKYNIKLLKMAAEAVRRRKLIVENEGRAFMPSSEEQAALSLPDDIPMQDSEFLVRDVGLGRDEGRLKFLAILREFNATHRQEKRYRRCCNAYGTLSDWWSATLRGPPVIATGFWILITLLGVLSVQRQCPGYSEVYWYLYQPFFVFVTGVTYFWLTTVWAEPGALRPGAKAIPGYPEYAEVHFEYKRLLNEGTLQESQACTTCRIVKPLRSKHCSICGHCVLKFDHHCPFLDVDIGAGNYLNFIFFLICALLGGVIASAIVLVAAISKPAPGEVPCLGSHGYFDLWPIILPVSHAIGFLLTGMLLYQHVPLIKDNFTTNERINLMKYKHFWAKGYIVNPFDFGTMFNFGMFFGCITEPIVNSISEAHQLASQNLKKWQSRKVETCHSHSHGSADADIHHIHDVHAEAL